MFKQKFIFIGILIGLFFITETSFAATFSWSSVESDVGVGESVLVDLYLDTNKEVVNAVEGEISLPTEDLDVLEVRLGQSQINFWLVEPSVNNGKIYFSGIIPGGYRGEKINVFSLVVKPKKVGVIDLKLDKVKVLLNDGLGSEAKVVSGVFKMTTQAGQTGRTVSSIVDKIAPEDFDIQIGKNETILEGKWFATFVANDKGVGISKYEIKESKSRILSIFSSWREVESPVLLMDQELNSFVWVKAIDKNNNQKVAFEESGNPPLFYVNHDVWIIIILVLIISFVVYKKWISTRRR